MDDFRAESDVTYEGCHWLCRGGDLLSLEIFANMDRQIQAAVELRLASGEAILLARETSPKPSTLL